MGLWANMLEVAIFRESQFGRGADFGHEWSRLFLGQHAYIHEPSPLVAPPIIFEYRRTSGEVDLQRGIVFQVD